MPVATLVYLYHADGGCFVQRFERDFDVHAWAANPARQRAFRFLRVTRIEFERL